MWLFEDDWASKADRRCILHSCHGMSKSGIREHRRKWCFCTLEAARAAQLVVGPSLKPETPFIRGELSKAWVGGQPNGVKYAIQPQYHTSNTNKSRHT